MSEQSGRPWRRFRDRVIARDRGICWICGHPGADTADHIVPVSKGGPLLELSNAAAAHHDVWPHCNRVRGNRSIEQARADVARRIQAADAASEARAWSW